MDYIETTQNIPCTDLCENTSHSIHVNHSDKVPTNNGSVIKTPNESKKRKKKKKSFNDIMSDITSRKISIEEEKKNHKEDLQKIMQSAQFKKLERI